MNFALRAIPLAVAAALLSGHVVADTPIAAWTAGASAPTKAVFNAFRSNCFGLVAGAEPITVYEQKAVSGLPGDTGTGNYFAYKCNFTPAKAGGLALVSDTAVTMWHTVEGGSFNIIQPPANLQRINSALLTPLIPPAPCVPLLSPAVGVTLYGSCGLETPGISTTSPDGGYSDVDSGLFKDLLGATPVPLTTSAGVMQVFGVAVNDALYTAMQTAQGLPLTEQPSISKQAYLSIASSSAAGAWHTDWAALLSPLVPGGPGTGKAINLCRRVSTSGSQASSNAYFLENPCRNGPLGGLLVPSTAAETVPGQYIVTEGASTGDVKTCLNTANATGNFAIGVMSAENTRGSSDKWKFVKLNGVSPNLDINQRKTGADGTYDFVVEMALRVRNSGKQTFYDELTKDMGDPGVTDLKGLFVTPGAFSYDGDKVGRGTKFGNNCQPQQLFF